MSNFGSEREANDGGVRQVYTGLENFKVISVNPSHEELKKIYGENAKEDKYLLENEVDGKMYPQIKMVIYCDNEPEEGEPKISTRPTFWITRAPLVSKEKGTSQYINLFGKTNWMTKEEADQKLEVYERVGANGTYRYSGNSSRLALRGEVEFIDFLRNLLNLPSPDKVKDPKEAASMFSMEDWDKMFKGDFSTVKRILEGSNNKIGLLLGAKTVDDNKVYQDVFTRQTLRQYGKNSGKYEYLLKELDNAVNNGAYGNVNWGPRDLKLRVYDESAVPTNVDAFANAGGTGGPEATSNSFFEPSEADSFGA